MEKEVLDNITAAISSGRTDIVRTLVTVCEKGDGLSESTNNDINPNAVLNSLCNEHGSLLHFATQLDNVDIVRTLLSSAADPSVRNHDGRTPYDLVSSERMATAYTEALLKYAGKSDVERIHLLVSSGVPIDSTDSPSSGNTALHWAACYGNAETVQCLLAHGAFINATNADGATPLHDAVSRKEFKVVKTLLEGGADPSLQCIRGKHKNKTPLDLSIGEQQLTALLLAYVSPSHSSRRGSNGNISTGSCSLESLRAENGLPEQIGHLSISSYDDPIKQDVPSLNSQSYSFRPLPHLSPPPPLVTDSRLYQLWPLPHEVVQTDGSSFKFKDTYFVSVVQDSDEKLVNDVIKTWESHSEDFSSVNVKCLVENIVPGFSPPRGKIMCHVSGEIFNRPQCYKIVVTSDQLRISAADIPGLHYSLCTLKQLFKLYYGESGIPSLYIKDWPVCSYRGVLFDLVPGARKPTVETLKGHIKVLSALKINQIHFYFRFEPKTGNKWPYTNSDLIAIANYCRQLCIDPIPALDVSPESCYEELYRFSLPVQELMAIFTSRSIHVGPNLSRMLLDMVSSGSSTKAADIFSKISNNSLYLCSNGFSFDGKLLQSLPLNSCLVEYGYQADYNYDMSLRPMVLAGLPVFIGVGTSSWGSISGCPRTSIDSIHKAAQCATLHDALGIVVADWKTVPHHCAFSFSWPGILVTAGLSWNSSVHLDFLHTHLPSLLNHWVLLDNEEHLGRLTFELGRLEAFVHSSVQDPNAFSLRPMQASSVLHQLLVDPDGITLDHFSLEVLQQAVKHIKRFELDLQKAKPECFQKGEVVAELQLAMDLMMFACRLARALVSNGLNPFNDCGTNIVNAGIANLPPTVKTDLANRLLAVVEQFRGVWLSRNLPCGLHSSLYLFNSLLHKFIPNSEQFFSSSEGFLRL